MTQVVMMDPADLVPYENNPRDNDGAVDAVAKSISEFGFRAPIIADGNRVIITGHTRLKAALQLGLREVPVIIAEDMTDEQARAYRLADNKTGELATWLESALAEELEAIEGIDMSQFGFDVPDGEAIEDAEAEITEKEFEPLAKVITIVICDLKDYDSIAGAIAEVSSKGGSIDVYQKTEQD